MALLGAGGDTCCAGTRAGRGRTDDRGLGIRILMQYPHTQPSPVYVSAYSARQGMRIRRLPKPKYPKVSMYPCVTRTYSRSYARLTLFRYIAAVVTERATFFWSYMGDTYPLYLVQGLIQTVSTVSGRDTVDTVCIVSQRIWTGV